MEDFGKEASQIPVSILVWSILEPYVHVVIRPGRWRSRSKRALALICISLRLERYTMGHTCHSDSRMVLNLTPKLDLILVVSFALLLIFITVWLQNSLDRTEVYPPSPRVLQTLSAFVTPTACALDHSSLLRKTNSLKVYLMELDLSDLIDSICSGRAELRDSSDLHDLFREKLRIYGWNFCLLVDINWSFRILRWMIAHHAYILLRVRIYHFRKQLY